MKNPYDEIKWGVLVNVNGPYNVLATHSFEEAATRANEINEALLAFQKTDTFQRESEFMPVVWAVVGVWGQIASGDHDPENTAWENACV